MSEGSVFGFGIPAYDAEFEFAKRFGERVEATDDGFTVVAYLYYGRVYITEFVEQLVKQEASLGGKDE